MGRCPEAVTRCARAQRAWLAVALTAAGALVALSPPVAHGQAPSGAPRPEPSLQLVESAPIETDLDHADIPDAYRVWPEMIASARGTLCFAQFYASNEPNSRLEPIVAAVEAAAARGVRVRFLAEKKFYATYPATLDRLADQTGIEVRIFDVAALMGGVLHAKYFLVDDREAFLGSQNFDWRALEHIQELGVRVKAPAVVAALQQVFDADWALAGGATRDEALSSHGSALEFPAAATAGESDVRVTPVFSPRGWLPDSTLWDLPRIVALIDGAQRSVRVQLLTYRAVGRDGEYFERLESALRRAAARGVEVHLLLADWSKRRGTIEGLQSLQALPGISVRLVTVPPWSGGFIPYARVIHAKYLVVDGRAAWIGTSNWERDYFFASRNVGLVVHGHTFAGRLADYFLENWNDPYAEPVDPCADYTPPRIGR